MAAGNSLNELENRLGITLSNAFHFYLVSGHTTRDVFIFGGLPTLSPERLSLALSLLGSAWLGGGFAS